MCIMCKFCCSIIESLCHFLVIIFKVEEHMLHRQRMHSPLSAEKQGTNSCASASKFTASALPSNKYPPAKHQLTWLNQQGLEEWFVDNITTNYRDPLYNLAHFSSHSSIGTSVNVAALAHYQFFYTVSDAHSSSHSSIGTSVNAAVFFIALLNFRQMQSIWYPGMYSILLFRSVQRQRRRFSSSIIFTSVCRPPVSDD